MSTLSGISAKGEKGKSKYVSLDINNLFQKNRGDSSETNQHKRTAPRHHGMQTLGKVPSARRPANLPSLKSEYSGNDPAISLVPSGGTGWGEAGPPPKSSTPPPPPPPSVPTPPVTATVAVSTTTTTSHGDKSWSSITSSNPEHSPVYLAHQSPYFQQEFPSLSGDPNAVSGTSTSKIDPAHLPGPSLRPQNEGNWIQGGGRPQMQMGAGAGNQQGTALAPGHLSLPHLPQGLDMGGVRSNLGHSGVGVGPGGPMPPPPHFRILPPFMIRHNMPTGGFPPICPPGPPRPRFMYDPRLMPPNRGPSNIEHNEVTSRPIIKDEDLKVMDEIGRDTGWAAHDEIDYNQTLSFSDEEGAKDDDSNGKNSRPSLQNKDKKDNDPKAPEIETKSPEVGVQEIARDTNISGDIRVNKGEIRESQGAWQQSRPSDFGQGVSPPSQGRPSPHQSRRPEDEDEVINERRRQHKEVVAIAIERARKRKEEEEKQYEESRLAAARKHQDLVEKLRSKSGLEKDESAVTPTPSVPQGSNALMPEWDKETTRITSEERDVKPSKETSDGFRRSGQADSRGQNRDRDNAGHQFMNRQYSNNVAPRFLRQAMENRAPSLYCRPPFNQSASSGNPPYERWQGGQPAHNFGGPGPGKHPKHYRDKLLGRDCEGEISKDHGSGFEIGEKERHETISESKETNSLYDDKANENKSEDCFKSVNLHKEEQTHDRESIQDGELETEMNDIPQKLGSRERLERPQRPDSRDSKASRESRNSRDEKFLEETCSHETVSSWADPPHQIEHLEGKHRKDFEDEPDTRRDGHGMPSYHHRHIPGPITQEKLEASESGKSSNLVPLVWSNDKKPEVKKVETKWEVGNNSEPWQQAPAADPVSWPTTKTPPTTDDDKKENVSDGQQLNPESDEKGQADTSGGNKSEVQRNVRGGHHGMRHDGRGPKQGSFRGGGSWPRGQMSGNRRPNPSREWGKNDVGSEVIDEAESNKEDRHNFSRSPKRGFRKSDRDDRSRESNRKQDNEKSNYSESDSHRYDKKPPYERMGFEPSGVPSRRGRGAGAFRSKGSTSSFGRGMVDGYGPPATKKPFESLSSTSHDEKKPDSSLHKENGDITHDESQKVNQQHQLSAGIIGQNARGNFKGQSHINPSRMQSKDGDKRDRKPKDNAGWRQRGSAKPGSGSGGEEVETSELDDRNLSDDKRNDNLRRDYNQRTSSKGTNRRQQDNRRFGRDKHNGGSYERDRRPMVNGSDEKKQPRTDMKEKRSNYSGEVVVDDQPDGTVEEDQTVFATDSNGFQEVRSKKAVKDGNRQQKEEPQRGYKERTRTHKPPGSQSPVTGNKGSDWAKLNRLPPRFAKMKEQSRQQHTQDGNESSKTNEIFGFPTKDLPNPAPPPVKNAWEKPITAALRTSTPPTTQAETISVEGSDPVHSVSSSQRSSPNEEKTVGKLPREPMEKTLLEGSSSSSVHTIIFENTNYKTGPADMAIKAKYSNQIAQNSENGAEEENLVTVGFKSPGPDMKLQDVKTEPIQMPISFPKNEDNVDMKLGFTLMDSELSQLTVDKTISPLPMTRSLQMTTQSSTDLEFKVKGVKKVWENSPAVLEHSGEDSTSYTTFSNPVEDPGTFAKSNDPSSIGDDSSTSEGVYNSGQPLQANPNSFVASSVQNMIKPDPSSNVCKVKPQPQSTMHPLSTPAPFTASAPPSQHINYQPQAQYGGLSTIPSPPTVFTQPHEQPLFQTFQINSQQVLSTPARSQFPQFAPYISQGLGQQSMFLHQTAAPPPTAAPTPDMFSTQLSHSQYRIQQAYGTSQQLNTNPSTVLIPSSTVKPPPQPIGAIGSKAQSYQTPSQPPSQILLYTDHQIMSQNYPLNSQLVRSTNNVVPPITPSSAPFYPPPTGGNAAYFQPGNTNLHHIPYNTPSPAATPSGMGSFGSSLPKFILQTNQPVGSRMQSTIHRSSSPAPPRAATSSPRINKMTQRQHNS